MQIRIFYRAPVSVIELYCTHVLSIISAHCLTSSFISSPGTFKAVKMGMLTLLAYGNWLLNCSKQTIIAFWSRASNISKFTMWLRSGPFMWMMF